ncbi:plasmid SOS inhibition protein A [Klebsiella variicola]|uniref:plasmid SOS inhibition protein A n=1 Tax=Klebsiella variicola TaxID=244366 RepID=UPI002B05266F|nr:plasmid SOS inhibition protein A [Klebsiella variicola]
MSVTESKAKATVKTSKKTVKPDEAAALKAALEAAQIEMVPLSSLVKSPLNVRTIPYPADSVREMADSIMAIGLIQNLVVHSLPDGISGVAAGGRRLAALQQLLSEQRIDAGYPVVVKRVSDDLAVVASMVENDKRVAMHPAEQISGFLRLLTGNSRMNTTVAQRIPGLSWDPKHRLSSLKQVEEALDALIASHGEYCPLPLPVDVQAELFPEVQHSRTERRKQRSSLAFTRKMRREKRALAHHWRLRQNLLGQAVTELNFQSPETVSRWYRRWADEFDARELAPAFWHWRSRFASLASLDWLRDAGEPLYEVMHEISFIVRGSGEHILERERWLVPNKLELREIKR